MYVTKKRGSKESYKLIHYPLQTLPSISSVDLSLSQLQRLISSILRLPFESAPLIGYADPKNTSFDTAFISLRCIKKVFSIYL